MPDSKACPHAEKTIVDSAMMMNSFFMRSPFFPVRHRAGVGISKNVARSRPAMRSGGGPAVYFHVRLELESHPMRKVSQPVLPSQHFLSPSSFLAEKIRRYPRVPFHLCIDMALKIVVPKAKSSECHQIAED